MRCFEADDYLGKRHFPQEGLKPSLLKVLLFLKQYESYKFEQYEKHKFQAFFSRIAFTQKFQAFFRRIAFTQKFAPIPIPRPCTQMSTHKSI